MMRQAKTISPNKSFKASRGWLNGFMRRKGLSLQCKLLYAKHRPTFMTYGIRVTVITNIELK